MNKYKIYTSLILIAILFSFTVKASSFPLIGKTIYIDPGHGGLDPGAMYKHIKESDIVLQIGLILVNKLEHKGATVYLTRNGDYDLSLKKDSNHKKSDLTKRSKIINDSKADLFISLHLNYMQDSRWNGSQVFYNKINKNNEIIAEYMQDILNQKREVKLIDTYLFKRITIPGVLIELGFLSNQQERNLLMDSDYQNNICDLIINGIITYFKY